MRPLALITGGSAGIGAAFARQLAARGYDLILVGRQLDRLERVAQELRQAHGVAVESQVADLATDAGQHGVEQWIRATDRLELLINNAGFGSRGRFMDVDLALQDQMHRLHILAPLRLTHAALPGMAARRRGAIINVSSVAGFVAAPGSVSYGATKHWMNGFTEALSLELKATGSPIRVQALCPGFTYSEFHDRLGVDREQIPARWWLKAEEVVALSLRGLERGQLFVVTGWRYQFAVWLTKVLPAPLRRALITRRQRRASRI